MTPAEIKALREKRGQLYSEMKTLLEGASKESRALNSEEKTKFDALDSEQGTIRQRIEDAQRLAEIGAETAARQDHVDQTDHAARQRDLPTSADARMAFQAWALGDEDRTAKHYEAAKKCGVNLAGNYNLRFADVAPRTLEELEKRASTSTLIVTDSTLGGNVIPNEPMQAIERALLEFGGMRSVARVIRTNTGATLPIPTVNDTTNVATIIGETSAIDQTNVFFGQITLGAFKYSSRFVRASVEFMQDNSINFAGYIGGLLGERVARGTNAHFTVGTGTTQPWGAVAQAISSTQHQVTYDGLVNLQHRLDPAYRRNGVWMFHDSVLKRIKNIVDTNGDPIWTMGLAGGTPDMILGHRYVINQDMATDGTASTAKVLSFGDFSKYLIRDVMDLQLRRLDERYADRGEVAFFTLSRHDGATLIASTANPPIVSQVPTT